MSNGFKSLHISTPLPPQLMLYPTNIREMCRLDSHLRITCRTADTLQTCQGPHTAGKQARQSTKLREGKVFYASSWQVLLPGTCAGNTATLPLELSPHCYFIHWHSGQKNKSLLFKSLAVWPQEETNIAPCNIKWKVSCYTNRSKHFPRNVLF